MASAIYLAELWAPSRRSWFSSVATPLASCRPATVNGGASIYPAVQHLLLAARASGLGDWLTTLHLRYEADVKALLGIPKGVDTYALVPLGYHRDKFGPLRRRPVKEVTYLDVWAPTCRARRCAWQ